MQGLSEAPGGVKRRRFVAAWGVHAFTMTGIVWACLAVSALLDNQILQMWGWLVLAMVVDGVDGTLARRAEVKTYAPWFDGSILDIVIDYLTWTFIPAIFMYRHLPLGPTPLAMTMFILVCASSLFCYCNTKMKTDDNYFMGFPAAWNIVALLMWLFGTQIVFNVVTIVVLAVLTLAPITFVHPLRVKTLRPVNVTAAITWNITSVILVLIFPAKPVWAVVIWWASGLWIIAISAFRTVMGKQAS